MNKTSVEPHVLAARYARMQEGDKRYQYLDPACDYCRWDPRGQCLDHLMQVGAFQNARADLRAAVHAVEEITDRARPAP